MIKINFKSFIISIILTNTFFSCSDNKTACCTMEVERHVLDSIHRINIYKKSNKVLIVEFTANDYAEKVGLLDSSYTNEYLLMNPYSGSELFMFNCSSCHYEYPSFKETIKSEVPRTVFQMREVICGKRHIKVDSVSCWNLNNFELFLITNYLNGPN